MEPYRVHVNFIYHISSYFVSILNKENNISIRFLKRKN